MKMSQSTTIQHYYGLNNLINSGPYDYESELVKTTNHLSFEDNLRFSERVLNDLNGTQ